MSDKRQRLNDRIESRISCVFADAFADLEEDEIDRLYESLRRYRKQQTQPSTAGGDHSEGGVEAVARAICSTTPPYRNPDLLVTINIGTGEEKPAWNLYNRQAKAAIDAYRKARQP